jgi:uncharacterized membrane protein
VKVKVDLKNKHTWFVVGVFLCMVFIVLSSINMNRKMSLPEYYQQDFEEAIVEEILEETLEQDDIVPNLSIGKQKLKVRVITGQYKDEVYETVNLLSRGHNVLAKEDLHIIVGLRETDDGVNAWVYNHKRENYIYILIVLFIGLLLIFGGVKGFYSALSLLFTGIMIIFVMIPLIFRGYDPIVTAISITSIITLVSFILIGGFERKTVAAIAGTIIGIASAGCLSYLFGQLANISGVNMEKGEQLVYIATDYQIQVKGLMFASILVASLGAVMDVAMSVASSVQVIHYNKPDIKASDLLKSALRVGRDIMGTMANTLILAFAGGSLSLILLIWGYQMTYKQMINMPFIAIEVIQGLSGSIGVILTVPFTAIVSVWLFRNK